MNNSEIVISMNNFNALTEMLKTFRVVDPELIKCCELLTEKLKLATIVDEKKVPDNVAQLNSIVTVSTSFGRKVGLKLVLPHEADFYERKLSIVSSLGTAFFGMKEGSKTLWHFPNGDEWITIERVDNTELHLPLKTYA